MFAPGGFPVTLTVKKESDSKSTKDPSAEPQFRVYSITMIF